MWFTNNSFKKLSVFTGTISDSPEVNSKVAADAPGLLMRRQLIAKFAEHGEEEVHGGSGRAQAPAPDQLGASHPFATEAMCLEMTYSHAQPNPA